MNLATLQQGTMQSPGLQGATIAGTSHSEELPWGFPPCSCPASQSPGVLLEVFLNHAPKFQLFELQSTVPSRGVCPSPLKTLLLGLLAFF